MPVQGAKESAAADRAYWQLKRDEGELIPLGSVIGVFADGVSKTTAGTSTVGVVPHTPDKVGPLPPTEKRNPDGTYSSNKEILKACVGEVPVRVPAGFSVPEAVRPRGPWWLMPSGKNDGLAAIWDGSGPRFGFVKPGSQVWQTEAGHFVMCCVDFAGGSSTEQAIASILAAPSCEHLRLGRALLLSVQEKMVDTSMALLAKPFQFCWAELFCRLLPMSPEDPGHKEWAKLLGKLNVMENEVMCAAVETFCGLVEKTARVVVMVLLTYFSVTIIRIGVPLSFLGAVWTLCHIFVLVFVALLIPIVGLRFLTPSGLTPTGSAEAATFLRNFFVSSSSDLLSTDWNQLTLSQVVPPAVGAGFLVAILYGSTLCTILLQRFTRSRLFVRLHGWLNAHLSGTVFRTEEEADELCPV
jgi:hypothetical protein